MAMFHSPFRKTFTLLLMTHACHYLIAGQKKDVAGYVVSLMGDVLVQGKTTTEGAPIHEGDTIHTASASQIRVLMQDNNVLDVGPNSNIAVQPTKEPGTKTTDLFLQMGTVRAQVQKKLQNEKFFLRTRASVLSVRGTEFVAEVRSDNGNFRESFTVASGIVDLHSGSLAKGTLALSTNQRFINQFREGDRTLAQTSPKAPQVAQVPSNEMGAFLKSNTITKDFFGAAVPKTTTVDKVNSTPEVQTFIAKSVPPKISITDTTQFRPDNPGRTNPAGPSDTQRAIDSGLSINSNATLTIQFQE